MVGHRQQKGLLIHHAKRSESTDPVSQLPVGGHDALHLAAAPRRYIEDMFTDLVRSVAQDHDEALKTSCLVGEDDPFGKGQTEQRNRWLGAAIAQRSYTGTLAGSQHDDGGDAKIASCTYQ